MIKVNLIGSSRKKTAKTRASIAIPSNVMPLVLLLIFVAAAAGGFLWYYKLDSESKDLATKITTLQQQKARLDAVIKTDQVFETRKKSFENRIKIIEGLKRNQVNPILAMDVLSEAIEKTQYVWLSQLNQNNAVLDMSGVGTSLNAIADFFSNLENTGYFHSIELANATDAAGNFTFSLKCEFKAPAPKQETPAAVNGGN